MKSIFQSKTFWFNIAAAVATAADQIAGSGMLGPWALVGVNAANVFLRSITKDGVTWA